MTFQTPEATAVAGSQRMTFVAKANASRLTEKRLNGPADLVIEVVSDDSVERDYDEKFIEYQDCGVQEYWIVDPRPRRNRALFYQRGADDLLEAVNPEGGVYRSRATPGLWIKTAWLWAMPDVQLTLAEIAGFSEATLAELRQKKRG
jgi:Uma2 family endonuclease